MQTEFRFSFPTLAFADPDCFTLRLRRFLLLLEKQVVHSQMRRHPLLYPLMLERINRVDSGLGLPLQKQGKELSEVCIRNPFFQFFAEIINGFSGSYLFAEISLFKKYS